MAALLIRWTSCSSRNTPWTKAAHSFRASRSSTPAANSSDAFVANASRTMPPASLSPRAMRSKQACFAAPKAAGFEEPPAEPPVDVSHALLSHAVAATTAVGETKTSRGTPPKNKATPGRW